MTALMAFKLGFYFALGGALGLVAAGIILVSAVYLVAAWTWADELDEKESRRG